MAGIYVFAAAALLMAGAAIGVVAVVSLAIRREDHDLSLTRDITNRKSPGRPADKRRGHPGLGLGDEPGYHRRNT